MGVTNLWIAKRDTKSPKGLLGNSLFYVQVYVQVSSTCRSSVIQLTQLFGSSDEVIHLAELQSEAFSHEEMGFQPITVLSVEKLEVAMTSKLLKPQKKNWKTRLDSAASTAAVYQRRSRFFFPLRRTANDRTCGLFPSSWLAAGGAELKGSWANSHQLNWTASPVRLHPIISLIWLTAPFFFRH